eukprot:gene11282-8015_t
MQHDEVVWQIINQGFCSFKTKIARERTFCQNPYNVTGLCLRSACPLANSLYATIREEEGVCYLFIKTTERAHSPKNLWEKIQLPANYTKALEIVSKHLEYFPKLKLKEKPKLVTINTKVEQREKGRERKALKAAQLERAIEKELLERLKQVTDNEIYNYPEQQYSKVINKASDEYEEEEGEEEDEEEEGEEEEGEEEDAEYEEELEEEDGEEGEYNVEYIEDFEESDEEEEDMEEMGSLPSRFSAPSLSYYSKSSKGVSSSSSATGKRGHDDDTTDAGSKRARTDNSSKKESKKGGKGKGTRVEIEYEEEEEAPRQRLRSSAGRADTSDMDFNF